MAIFPTSVNSDEEAIVFLANSVAQNSQSTVKTGSTDISPTAAEFINGLAKQSGGSTATITTPTAAAIVAALPNPQIGSSFDFAIINGNSGNTTIAAGDGVTIDGSTTVATTKRAICKAVVTNVAAPAVTLYVIGVAVA